ncbi:hypothetical protein CORC01_11748 [Colletotrichum orchidophilum]|uniref:Polyamine transport protein n=1 Tax=Colletotrichum orchidophilum TaxID=1209926 RepID=A0A1G4AV20_9PEZI|nr:uncharacterized protein CORC01_11748 [Colletotrichum orchidophilum]OHE92955.1 hypothetical protein CORC01_11748 [Colletotrichum orchidophilum]
MSEATRTRSLTPPTEVQRLTDPNTSAYKQTALRRYSSADKLTETSRSLRSRSSDSPPTNIRIDFCCPSQADLALNRTAAEKPAMLSNFFHPTKVTTTRIREPSNATVDFEDTPLPSAQHSMRDMSLKKPEKDVASSFSSAKSGSFRHALLKTASGRPIHENKSKIAIPSRKFSPTQMVDNPAPTIPQHLMENTTNFDPYFPRETVCVDPLIHPDESHTKAHHRGLLKGADFCNTGVPGQPVAQLPETSSLSSLTSSASSQAEVVHAKVRRAMTGDDLCLSTVEVTVPKHDGHSHAMKVRPAFNLPTFQYPSIGRQQHSPLGVSKVRPFDPAKEHLLPERYINKSTVIEENRDGSANIPVSKVRPFAQEPPELNHHAGHQSVSKVRPFSDESENGKRKNQDAYFAVGSDESASDGSTRVPKPRSESTSRSRASTIDYKRTTQWLRHLLKNPEAHTAKLTEKPSKVKRASYISLKASREQSPIPRKMTRHPTLPPSDVEQGFFQSTFGELERLLQEALTLASRVADDEEAKSPESVQPPRHVSTEAAAYDNSLQFSDIDLNDNSISKKTLFKRAATFPHAGQPGISFVDDLYRNISLTPQTVELENMLDHKKPSIVKKTNRRYKTRSRQAAPVPDRISSRKRSKNGKKSKHTSPKEIVEQLPTGSESSMDGSDESSAVNLSTRNQAQEGNKPARPRASTKRVPFISRNTGEDNLPQDDLAGRPIRNPRGVSLHGKSHVSLRGVQAFSLVKSNRRQPIARDWSPVRKRAIATVACISTALIGMIIGIYAGLVPSLQYYILDTIIPTKKSWTTLIFGFLIGAAVIDQLPPDFGFYVSIALTAIALLLNTLCPEVRRSAFRRSVVEVRTGTDISRRVARGEIMMHRVKTGPRWWGQELYHGIALCFEMLRQPGFAVMAVYSGWIYAQVVLIIVLLGSLTSRFYRMRSPFVGLMVSAIAFGALAAIPFQKASYFSRARHTQVNTSRMTFDKQVTWTSHLLRRSIFAIGLPLAGIIYTLVSTGPPMHPVAPAIVAAAIGFLSCLAISECNGLIMETFDTSDLQSGLTGRPRGNSDNAQKKKNYSSYPRVTAGFAVCHTLGFIFAAGATALGGMAQRNLEVVIIPESKTEAMDRWTAARRESIKRRYSMPTGVMGDKDVIAEEEPWRPFIVGNPTSKTRRVNVLELGSLSRFTEIRKRNKLVDANQHLNREAFDAGIDALDDQISDVMSDIVDDVKDLENDWNP